MRRPIIGITSGEIRNANHPWAPYVFGQSYTYVESVTMAGGLPMILPIVADEAMVNQYAETLDGMLFSGGNDIHPQRYNQEMNGSVETSEARDNFEFMLMQKFLKTRKPILAICRGQQLLNVALGGTLYQDISTNFPDAEIHTSSPDKKSTEHLAHELKISENSKLAKILGTTAISCNSHHHQSINKLGEGLVVTSRAADGIVESIENPQYAFIIGVQSHPESLVQRAQPQWRKLFEEFIAQANSN